MAQNYNFKAALNVILTKNQTTTLVKKKRFNF